MTAVCLVVSSIIGAACYMAPVNFAPPGECSHVGDVTICHVEEGALPVLASWYDPFIVTDNPAIAAYQCMEPCDQLGDGTPVAEGYGRYAACPLGWYGRWVEFVGVGVRQCRDHGGAVKVSCGDRGAGYGCWIVVDFLEQEAPWWAHSLLEWRVIDQ